ncbi:MAG: hypothetical protein GF350_09500 [Chitinivibrionales bacterium]|nr:hypothetical protein [Chitinivibrionales bacterium]
MFGFCLCNRFDFFKALIPVITAATCSFSITYYVSPDGDDGNDGYESSPFKTLVKTRDALRQITGESKTVIIKPGNCFLDEPLVLDENDGGTEQYPVVWKGEYFSNMPAIYGGGCKLYNNSIHDLYHLVCPTRSDLDRPRFSCHLSRRHCIFPDAGYTPCKVGDDSIMVNAGWNGVDIVNWYIVGPQPITYIPQTQLFSSESEPFIQTGARPVNTPDVPGSRAIALGRSPEGILVLFTGSLRHSVKLFSMNGRIVYSAEGHGHCVHAIMRHMAGNGVYVIQTITGAKRLIKKIALSR